MRPDQHPRHAATERAFHAALWSAATPDGLASPSPEEIPRRFAVYRNNVRSGLARALAARFPAVEKLVGPAFFVAMAGVFAAEHPPRHPVLLGWGETLPEFLAGFPPVEGLPYLPDVARLELARGRAYHAADAAPVAAEALAAAADPGTLRLRLHPSAALFASAFPAVGIWAAQQAGAAPGPLAAAGPEQALVARNPDLAVVVEPVDAATHGVLAALASGETLAAAAARAEPAPALALLLRHGLIAAIETGVRR